jgi:NAD(P)-dependent dehydrogenase (short-subunit alcohol dehydrogenase family)
MSNPGVPSPVPTWHKDTYAAISPSRPELSLADKVTIITGAGTGIGQGLALTAAKAGATTVHVLGRTKKTLEETKSLVEKDYPKTTVIVHVADLADADAVNTAAKSIGTWHVLFANAGYLPSRSPIASADPVDWWRGFEINVKGNFVLMQAFLPTKATDASIVATSTGVAHMPAMFEYSKHGSGYSVSKMGMTKFYEHIAAENPDVQVVIIQPGVIDTPMNRKSGVQNPAFADTMDLSTDFRLWCASPEAKFLSGRFVWVNWDVEELKGLKDRFVQDPTYLATGLVGWA